LLQKGHLAVKGLSSNTTKAEPAAAG